jgi:EAL domain-containing protein (putative c-di-GMP-specific phosphodiesterase class I)
VAQALPRTPTGVLAFVNMHPRDLDDPDLYDAGAPLSRLAARVVLEVTERASLDGCHDVPERMARLRALGFRIAVDDLGAGYAGLSSLAKLEPEFIKLDMSLVRDVHQHPVKQQLVRSMTNLAHSLGLGAVAEGVETIEELGALVDAGLDLFQGYYFARPDRQLVTPPAARMIWGNETRSRGTPARPRSRDSSPN